MCLHSERPAARLSPRLTHKYLVSEHSKVKDDSLAQRVLAEGGVTGFLEHSGASCFYGLRSSSFADAYTTFQA